MDKIFLPLLALLFIGLKLTGFIAWSWLWVLAPLWVGFVFVFAILVIWLIAVVLFGATSRPRQVSKFNRFR